MGVVRIARRARGTVAVLRRMPGQRSASAHTVARERLLERRDARVRDLVRYAAATVPYYRERFREEGLDQLRTVLRGGHVDVLHVPTLEPVPGRKFRPVVPLGTARPADLARASG